MFYVFLQSANQSDDEDLESLRLAALQSLKKQKNEGLNQLGEFHENTNFTYKFNGTVRGLNKRGRGFHHPVQNGRSRNVRFISIYLKIFSYWFLLTFVLHLEYF